jgi:23S rRNA (uracil1939-C5)-methyltransferase
MTDKDEWLTVESLDLEGRGVARNAQGKVVFIDGALPGEAVRVQVSRSKNNWEQATMIALRRESAQRVRPVCPHFGLHAGACGGCKVQHLHPSAQVAVKQRVLEDSLWHLAKVKPELMLRPIEGPSTGYRFRARLSVRHVHKKGAVLVGFHERKSSYVADMTSCAVLPPHVSALLVPLRDLIFSMAQRDRLPQIELAAGDEVTALVLRHLEPLVEADLTRLRAFALEHGVQWWLQAKGPDSVTLLGDNAGAEGPRLAYALPEFDLTMPFAPTDFTQVNPRINEVLVGRALRLLDARSDERVIDWFCGLGNFTLPIATRAREVLGVEGSETLVARSRRNAELNEAAHPGLGRRVRFVARNLFEMTPQVLARDGAADKWLVDPPREGAFALVKALAELHADPAQAPGWAPPRRIVYVSCNPATLARDAGLLVHEAGYRCAAAGVVNMFPHTAHVESIAVFDLERAPPDHAGAG